MNEAGEFFGDERLHRPAGGHGHAAASETGRRILAGVAAFVGDAAPSDDVSVLVVRRSSGTRVTRERANRDTVG